MENTLNVYVANFGSRTTNGRLQRARTVATMNDVQAHAYWLAGDRENYIRTRMENGPLLGSCQQDRWPHVGSTSCPSFSQTQGDVWLHSDTKSIWWTTSRAGDPTYEARTEPVARKRDVIICHKPCDPWRNTNALGNPASLGRTAPQGEGISFQRRPRSKR